jgi:benzoate transport
MTPGGPAAIDEQPMSRFQVGAVAICTVLNAVDGFDVLAMSFAAPLVSKEWVLSQDRLGLLFSAGLAGMTIGSAFIAPLADMLGRRWVTLLSLAVVTLGMFWAAVTSSALGMTAARCFTGLGVGAMLPSINTIVAEYSSAKRRELSLSIMATGYPIGATLGGMISVLIVAGFGWRGIFAFGGLLSLIMIFVVYLALPESLGFLLAKRPANALARINRLLRRLERAEIASLPAPQTRETGAVGFADLARGGLAKSSALLFFAFFCVMSSFYFVLQWTPKLLVDAGLNPQQGISGGVLLNLGGIVGALLLGSFALRFAIFRIEMLAMVLAAITIAAFGLASANLGGALATAPIVGVFLFASMVGLYAIAPGIFPTSVRNTGTGLAIGAGRGGAILSPWLAGQLLELGWSPRTLFLAFGAPLLFGASAILVLHRQAAK